MGNYPSPPITEAVIAIYFEQVLSENEQEKISQKLSSFYDTVGDYVHKNVNVNLDLTRSNAKVTSVDQKIIRRANNAQDEIFIAAPQNIIVSQLAVYPGWEYFFNRFKRDWEIVKNVLSYRKINRIGLRFINRIDIPIKDGVARYEDFINLHIQIPPILDPFNSCAFMVQKYFPDYKADAIINAASVPSPFPESCAFLLDIDIVRTQAPPQSDNDIMSYLDTSARQLKNNIFENSITDAARELFK